MTDSQKLPVPITDTLLADLNKGGKEGLQNDAFEDLLQFLGTNCPRQQTMATLVDEGVKKTTNSVDVSRMRREFCPDVTQEIGHQRETIVQEKNLNDCEQSVLPKGIEVG